MMAERHGPLDGVRVVDMTSIGMGPYATQILGDMGADVIKVESPDGDVFRHAAPKRGAGMGAAFLNLNRNKRSIVLDLKQEAARAVLLRLVGRADVLVYNVRPQAMKKLGLDFASLSAVNPRLIHCGAYGYSEAGPYGGMPAYDDIIQARSGLAHFQGLAGGEPAYAATILADKTVGLTLAYAIMAALYARERTGRGQAVEVPMFETMVSFAMVEHLAGYSFDPPVAPAGYDRVLSTHRRPYRTKDGYIAALPYTTGQWTRFFELAGRPELATDERFADPGARSRNIDELYRTLAELLALRTTDDWHAMLTEADIPVSRIMTPDDLLADPHLEAIGFWDRRRHPSEGGVVGIGIPTRFSDTPPSVRRLAPQQGEHSREVLAELGLTAEEQETLIGAGACRTG